MNSGADKPAIAIRKLFADPQAALFFRVKSLPEIKDSCIYVIDTNVLLVPYTISKESVSVLRDTFSRLIAEKRLVVPAQVIREFLKNRPLKISEVHQQLQRKLDGLTAYHIGNYPLLEDQPSYRDLMKSEATIGNEVELYRKKLKTLIDELRSWNHDDPVSRIYRAVFTKEAIHEPDLDEAEVLSDLKWRNENKIPPGYKDGAKLDQGVGDLIIWKSILDVGVSRAADVVFVTNETKADWWHGSEHIPLMPRIELVEEFRSKTSGRSFTMVNLSGLFKVLGLGQQVVTEIEQQDELIASKQIIVMLKTLHGMTGQHVSRIAQAQGLSTEDIPLSTLVENLGASRLPASVNVEILKNALRFCECAFLRGDEKPKRFHWAQDVLRKNLPLLRSASGLTQESTDDEESSSTK